MDTFPWDAVRFDERGLVPAVVQDARTGQVLMLAYMNRDALERTLQTGEAHFWSRSRQALWHKGATSGNTQKVVDIRLDCDGDALLLLVEPRGPACHTGAVSCFFRGYRLVEEDREEDAQGDFLATLYRVLEDRKRNPRPGSYTARLLEQGTVQVLKKVGEEAVEVLLAAQYQDDTRLVEEVADLLYHVLVLLVAQEVPWSRVVQELRSRHRPRGGAASESEDRGNAAASRQG